MVGSSEIFSLGQLEANQINITFGVDRIRFLHICSSTSNGSAGQVSWVGVTIASI